MLSAGAKASALMSRILNFVTTNDLAGEYFNFIKNSSLMTTSSKNSLWNRAQVQAHRGYVTIRPDGHDEELPVIYLLHGQGDSIEDWYDHASKGRLIDLLNKHLSIPALIVLPLGRGNRRGTEPSLRNMIRRFESIAKRVENGSRGAVDRSRRIILGVSMGGKQALAIVLHEKTRRTEGRSFQLLGILSGKFQGNNLLEVERIMNGNKWAALGQEVFHYCGRGADPKPRKVDGKIVRRERGDGPIFLEGNRIVASRLNTKLRTKINGLHNWDYWGEQLERFFGLVVRKWSNRS